MSLVSLADLALYHIVQIEMLGLLSSININLCRNGVHNVPVVQQVRVLSLIRSHDQHPVSKITGQLLTEVSFMLCDEGICLHKLVEKRAIQSIIVHSGPEISFYVREHWNAFDSSCELHRRDGTVQVCQSTRVQLIAVKLEAVKTILHLDVALTVLGRVLKEVLIGGFDLDLVVIAYVDRDKISIVVTFLAIVICIVSKKRIWIWIRWQVGDAKMCTLFPWLSVWQYWIWLWLAKVNVIE